VSSVSYFISYKSTPIVFQVYNASNNELVRTNTLVKGAIIQVDAAPFRQWYEAHVCFPFEGGP
jgi:small subunit ribosomal protein S8e